MDGLPPAHYVTVCDQQTRGVRFHGAVIKLAQMNDVRMNLAGNRFEIFSRGLQVSFGILHPLQLECGRAVIEIESVHPLNLVSHGNIAEADQRDAMAAAEQSSDQLTRPGPDSSNRISGD